MNSRVVGLVTLEPYQHIVNKGFEMRSAGHRLHHRSDRLATTRRLDPITESAIPTRIVHANLAALMRDLEGELQAYYAKLDAVR
ncbi:MAG: hypothetical protein GTO53_11700 [Planctomycetales bacterium]|nr:hypothetical protein [Planctomycetales bacterium]